PPARALVLLSGTATRFETMINCPKGDPFRSTEGRSKPELSHKSWKYNRRAHFTSAGFAVAGPSPIITKRCVPVFGAIEVHLLTVVGHKRPSRNRDGGI